MNTINTLFLTLITLSVVACGGPERIARRGVDGFTGATNNRDGQMDDQDNNETSNDSGDEETDSEPVLVGLELFAACTQLSLDEVEPQADMDMDQIQPVCDAIGAAAFVTNMELDSVESLEFM